MLGQAGKSFEKDVARRAGKIIEGGLSVSDCKLLEEYLEPRIS